MEVNARGRNATDLEDGCRGVAVVERVQHSLGSRHLIWDHSNGHQSLQRYEMHAGSERDGRARS
eukprot:701853-Rhodomonas_salina.6